MNFVEKLGDKEEIKNKKQTSITEMTKTENKVACTKRANTSKSKSTRKGRAYLKSDRKRLREYRKIDHGIVE